MTKNLMAALSKIYEKPSVSNKVFLMKKLFNLKMTESESVSRHLNEFNTLTSQLESVEINYDDKIRVLVLLSSLLDAWDGLVMTVSSYGTGSLKFDDALGVLLSEKTRKKLSGSAETSGSALSVDQRGRLVNREKKSGKSKFKTGRGNSM